MSLPKTWIDGVNSWCIFSLDRVYRYELVRYLQGTRLLRVCIGLNPSTADATRDDPTIRRLYARSYADGFNRMVMLNLFAYRATDPREMLKHRDPAGPDNDAAIKHWALVADMVVMCWGAHGSHLGRSAQVLDMLRPYAEKLYCFGLTKSGEPKHPLYLPKNTPLVKWKYLT